MRNANWRKRSLALVLSAVMVTGVLAGSTLQVKAVANINTTKWANAPLGQLSAKYETGNATDPGIVADVNGDIGGTSFGIYMFAKSANTPYLFAQWCQSQPVYAAIGDRLVYAYKYNSSGVEDHGYGSNFKAAWKAEAEINAQLFAEAQHAFVQDQIYQALVNKLEAGVSGFKIDNYSDALKNVLWSRGVQHGVGGAYDMIVSAFNAVGGFKGQSEAKLIEAIYARSGATMDAAQLAAETDKFDAGKHKPMTGTTADKYGIAGQYERYYFGNSGDVQLGVYYRLRINEPSDALEILYEKSSAQWHEGSYTLVASGTNCLGSDLSVGTTEVGWTLTPFAGGYYTIEDASGNRLGADGGEVKLLSPSAGDAQKWVWSADTNSWKNVGTGKYLVASGNGVALSDEPHAWAVKVSGTDWKLYGAYYPGMGDNVLHQGSSSFPVRGVLTSASVITGVTVSVLDSSNQPIPYATSSITGEMYAVSLEAVDDNVAISKLPQGSYTFLVTATIGGETKKIIKKEFPVAEKVVQSEITEEDKFTVSFDPAGGSFDGGVTAYSKILKLGEPYGELPTVTKAGADFSGWFLGDTQVAPNSIAAAGNHTLTAKYGKLYTYTFLNANGGTFKTGQLSDGALVPNPGGATKASDGTYVYSFSHWVLQDTDTRYVSGTTFINATNLTFVPVFTAEKVTYNGDSGNTGGGGGSFSGGGGSTGGEVSGNYLTGVTPGTSVSSLSGYTVYKNGTQVTSGTVGTGMTARSGGTEVTIVVTGDTSGDGKITITDVVKLQSHVVGKATLSGAYAKAADVNRDGKVTITDVVQAAQVTVGKRSIG